MTRTPAPTPALAPPSARPERGASAVEYGLLIAGVAALIVAIVLLFGGAVTDLFTDSCTEVTAEADPTADCTP